MAIKVTLRKKPISGQRQTLYLDYYPAIPHPETGKPTRREFLGLYIPDKPKTPEEKQRSKEQLIQGELIRTQRENNLNKPEIYNDFEKEQLKLKQIDEQCFVEYFKSLVDKRTGSNKDNWDATNKYLVSYTGGKLKFADLNEKFCNDFKQYLLSVKRSNASQSTLSTNTASSYFNKLKAGLKEAYKDGLLKFDLNVRISPIKEAETQRNFLTIEELNALVKTECQNPMLKRAALFSALTGLRFVDIKHLTWKEIEFIEGNGYFVKFTQVKTKGVEMMPISEQAYGFLGERKGLEALIFDGLEYSNHTSRHIAQWLGLAGISKNITFHCFRHTYATLQLSHGTNIYTISKMLGHRSVKTTQIYTKIIDPLKRDAANKIVLDE